MKKLLVISNGCFSLTDSNGRTLEKLLKDYDPKKLAQVFTYGTPDFDMCENYYRVTDKDVIKALFSCGACGRVVAQEKKEVSQLNATVKKATKRTPFRKLVRELTWQLSNWENKGFLKWADAFKPEEILVFAGDSGFLMNTARKLAKRYGIKITIYTTEDYCFKKYNYLTRRKSLFYSLFFSKLKSAYKKTEPFVKKGFFNTPLLTKCYEDEFSFDCECLFAKSDIDFVKAQAKVDREEIKVSYLGNLGLKRHLPLIEIADALGVIAPGTRLAVYGSATESVQKELSENKNIDYRGFVGYDDVVKIIHNSDLVVHAEYDEPFNLLDLKAAFSTKIPDSISSGTPLFVYANENLACTNFVIKNQCAFIAKNSSELKVTLEAALFDSEKREVVMAQAEKVKKEFFASERTLTAYFN